MPGVRLVEDDGSSHSLHPGGRGLRWVSGHWETEQISEMSCLRDCFWPPAARGMKPASVLTTCVVLTKYFYLFELISSFGKWELYKNPSNRFVGGLNEAVNRSV